MKHLIFYLGAMVMLNQACNSIGQDSVSERDNRLSENFHNPPIDARPRGLWTWVNGNYDSTEIWREIREAKATGMGGFDIWDAPTVQDPKGVVPVGPDQLSDEFMRGVNIAMEAARKTDFQLGYIWNQSVSSLDPGNSHMALYLTTLKVDQPGNQTFELPFPYIKPHKKHGYKVLQQDQEGRPLHWDNVAVLAYPINQADSNLIKKDELVNLTQNIKGDQLTWDVPAGDWKILRFVWSRTAENGLTPTPATLKPALDFLNPEATEKHLTYLLDLMVKHTGPLENSPLQYLCADSYEFKGLWTPAFPEIFQDSLGYDLISYLPALEGYTIDNQETTDRFLFDFNNLRSDLVIQNHYAKAKEICNRYGIGFTAEAAGPGPPVHLDVPMESIKSSGALTFPRGEFWVRDNDKPREHLQIIKGIASAAHLYNQPYVTAEAFTGVHLWSFGPGDLKPYADRAFAEGLNRIDFHTFSHTPPAAGLPGWIYSFGNIISENLVWWPKANGFMNYLGRSSYMLQQGNYVGDVLYYHGQEAPFFAKPKHVKPELGLGYNYDIANADILLNHLSVKDGKLHLPHGQQYEILVLPDKNWMTLPVLQKVRKLLQDGATIIGPKPDRSNGLSGDKINGDQRVKALAGELWKDIDGENVTEVKIGKGKLIWGKTPRQVLLNKGITPDVIFNTAQAGDTLDFIHRRLDQTEIYFIRNPYPREVAATLSLRISNKQPEKWDPVTGEMVPLTVYQNQADRTALPVSLAPEGSFFLVFQDQKSDLVEISKDGELIFPANKSIDSWSFIDLGNEKIKFTVPGKYQVTRNNQKQEIQVGDLQNISVANPVWQLNFRDPWGEQFSSETSDLKSWTEFDQHRVKYFSGTGSYENEFELPRTTVETNKQVILDLGQVEEVAEVFINGQSAGLVWTQPAELDITDIVQAGSNELKIEVVNRWPNRMIGDYKLPDAERKVKSSIVTLPTAWHAPLETLPSDNYQLQPSGLLGPISIRIFDTIVVD